MLAYIALRRWHLGRAAALSFAVVSGVALAITTVGFTSPVIAGFAPGLTFRISASTKVYPGDTPRAQDDEAVRGRGIAVNDHSRIEFLAYTPTPSDLTTDDYLFGLDSGKVVIEHTASKNFVPANDMFNGPAVVALGRVMGGSGRFGGAGGGAPGADGAAAGAGGGGNPGRGAGGGGRRGGGGGPPGGGARGGRRGGRGSVGQGFLSQIELLDVTFNVEKLGAGDAIEGHATQHYRVTADYRILWSDQSLPAHAVTELWTTALPTKIPNPFEPLIVADQSTDGPLIEYALKLRAARAQIEGVPIKVITTTTLTGIHDIVGFQSFVGNDSKVDKLTVVQQTQITGITAGDVDPALVKVPEVPDGP